MIKYEKFREAVRIYLMIAYKNDDEEIFHKMKWLEPKERLGQGWPNNIPSEIRFGSYINSYMKLKMNHKEKAFYVDINCLNKSPNVVWMSNVIKYRVEYLFEKMGYNVYKEME